MIVLNDLLEYKNYKIYQDTNMFCFSLDSILLGNFVTINKNCKKILDIGCGNAPIPLILTTKTKASIVGIEIQKEVSSLASKSVIYNKCEKQVEILNQDVNDFYKECESDTFDVITCNPPYFKINENTKQNLSEYKKFARHEIKLNLEQLFKIAKKLLKNKGFIATINRTDRLIEIIDCMKKNNIEPKKIQLIYPKANSNSNLVMIEGVKGGKTGLRVLPPIIVHNEDGTYKEEIKQIFKD